MADSTSPRLRGEVDLRALRASKSGERALPIAQIRGDAPHPARSLRLLATLSRKAGRGIHPTGRHPRAGRSRSSGACRRSRRMRIGSISRIRCRPAPGNNQRSVRLGKIVAHQSVDDLMLSNREAHGGPSPLCAGNIERQHDRPIGKLSSSLRRAATMGGLNIFKSKNVDGVPPPTVIIVDDPKVALSDGVFLAVSPEQVDDAAITDRSKSCPSFRRRSSWAHSCREVRGEAST